MKKITGCHTGKIQIILNFPFVYTISVAYPGFFFGGGSTNSVEDRENGNLGAVAP